MDIEYDTLVTQIQQFTNFKTGHFALTDEDGFVFYDPLYEMGTQLSDELPQLKSITEEMHRDSSAQQIFHFKNAGKDWLMTYTTLTNGMKLIAVVEESEINTASNRMSSVFVVSGMLILLVFAVLTTLLARFVTDPLKRLTAAAKKLAAGDYNVNLDYEGKDEVGVLTSTFREMSSRLKSNFNDLNAKANTDALTGVKNKGAYDQYTDGLNQFIQASDHTGKPEFALIVLDCDGLKAINDVYGHEKGDIFLSTACRFICKVFSHSPVFRIGGDEFVVILQDVDFQHRDELLAAFEKDSYVINEDAVDPWEHVHISKGLAVYNPDLDPDVNSVFQRADELMYEEKRNVRKAGFKPSGK